MSELDFKSLNLPPQLLENLDQLGYKQMTDIQAQSLPTTLQGQDLIGKAKTGSGKTASFAIPMLTKLNPRFFGIQGLVLCPTRELSTQVANEIRKIARYQPNIKVITLCGGQPIGPQIGSLEHGAHIVVGTPGRIKDHLRKGTLDLSSIETFVLDEADRMLDMGFFEEITHIAGFMPNERQTLLFSATFPADIAQFSKDFQKKPASVEVESSHAKSQIEQLFYKVEKGLENKNNGLLRILQNHTPTQAVVFCNTKQTCNDVSLFLRENGYIALSLQGDMEQKERDLTLVRFSNQSASVLVATDVAARGIDIDDLDAVINYDLPRDPEVYVHRIGRTGRAGKSGQAFSLYLGSEKMRYDLINSMQSSPIDILDIDRLKNYSNKPEKPEMVTIALDSGKKQKIRPGDILGALTGTIGIPGNCVGKINIFDFASYVAVARPEARKAVNGLMEGKIKGRKVRVRRI
ncbi:ATP-dependent RNA helicase DbpA [Litoribacillus peritrichatus]|uniref:ATP-dependent RNA helicase DbpA n=1 Tax=Litoribacillus peritrichatus TaxID=718191 RepID=A0ABP7N591_9GAMM